MLQEPNCLTCDEEQFFCGSTMHCNFQEYVCHARDSANEFGESTPSTAAARTAASTLPEALRVVGARAASLLLLASLYPERTSLNILNSQ